MKKSICGGLSVVLLLLLLWQPVLAFEGAKNGLLLWSQTVLPTLLPFMICSNVIVALDAIGLLTFPVRPLLRHGLKLSDGGCYILTSGILCGYPMGAKTCSEFLEDNCITQAEASYLLSICNHPSPMFLLGFVASRMTGAVPMSWVLLSLYLPVLVLAAVSRLFYGIKEPCSSSQDSHRQALSFDQTMMSSIEVMVKIGGYIMLFSILAYYLQKLPLHQAAMKSLLLGFVEITTGIQSLSLSMTGFPQALAMVAIIAFGGCSGIFQTKSVLKNAGLSIRHYIIWKLIHSLLSCLIFILLWAFLPLR